jgi:hypothetical protein
MQALPDEQLIDILARLHGSHIAHAACSSRCMLRAAEPAALQRIRALGTEPRPGEHWLEALRYAESCGALGRHLIAAGSTHTLIIIDGALQASGTDPEAAGDLSMLGVDTSATDELVPAAQRVLWVPMRVLPSVTRRVLEVAAGAMHSLALVSGGEVYSFGRNTHGQLGRRTPEATGSLPAVVGALTERRMRALRVAAGAYFSLVVSEDGRLFAFGSNAYGELGVEGGGNQHTPVEAATPAGGRLQAATGGRAHTLGLTRGGAVCAAGRNVHGQLGLGEEIEAAHVLTAVEALQREHVVQLACGNNHSLAVTLDGRVLAWGCGAGYQLGPAGSAPHLSARDAHLPRELRLWCTISGAITDLALLPAAAAPGSGVHGTPPQLPTRLRAVCVAAGHAHSLVMTEEGTVLVAGDAGLSPSFGILSPGLGNQGGDGVAYAVLRPEVYAASWAAEECGADSDPDAPRHSPGLRHRLCAGLRHSLLYAPSPAIAGGEPQLSHPAAISAFGLARHGQLGISADRLPHSGGLVQVPVSVVVGRARNAFKPPVLRGSALEKHFYGARRPDRLAALPEEERLRVLVSLGEAHAWRLPPSHPMYHPAP